MGHHPPEMLHHMGPDRRFWIVIGFVVLITLTEVAAQTCLKMAHKNEKKLLVAVGIFLYVCVAFTLYRCYAYEGLGHTNLVWSSLSIITALIVGVILFKEPHNRYNYIAAAFALGAIYFAHRGDEVN